MNEENKENKDSFTVNIMDSVDVDCVINASSSLRHQEEEDSDINVESFVSSSYSLDPVPFKIEIATPPRTKIKTKPPGFPSMRRQDTSLPIITKHLVDYLLEASSLGVEVKTRDAAKFLGYDSRRLYEVVNTLEAMDLIERNDGKIRWVGASAKGSETAQTYAELKQLRFEERLLQYNIDVMRAEISEDLRSTANTKRAYASFQDVTSCYTNEENVFIIQCPRESVIEVDDRSIHIRSPTPFEAFVPYISTTKVEVAEEFPLDLKSEIVDDGQFLRSAE